jgi:hypothetical protein
MDLSVLPKILVLLQNLGIGEPRWKANHKHKILLNNTNIR